MRPAAIRVLITLMMPAACLLPSTAPPAAAGPRIRAHQHYVGVVNGATGSATVFTVCPGPTGPGRLGPPAGGQTLSVAHRRAGTGYTGPFAQVHAWFVDNAAVNGPLQVTFRRYGVTHAIPSAVRVPCDGSGLVAFSSCPYLAPCAAGWVTTYVKVQYIDIAV